MKLVKGGSICIRHNDSNTPYFNPGKGLRQGDPLSPLLFNLVIDVFPRILIKATHRGYVTGFMKDMCPEGAISLQYANDTLLFLDHNERAACHLKWLMICFEQISGTKIKSHKSILPQ
jgi:hypothetical protein